MTMTGALYSGIVRHTRIRPRKLSLRHACFWIGLDLDDLDATVRRLRLFSRNRFNLLSFHDRDFGDAGEKSLREQTRARLAVAGILEEPARIELFCMPRVLGYGFNPLSLYFCRRADGSILAIVYEVHNTFGQRHAYVAPVEQGGDGGEGRIRQSVEKMFHVSPFMDMDMEYRFDVQIRPDRLLVSITGADSQGPIIFTSIDAASSALSSGALLRAWARRPLLTLKVIAAIHFHALRLWWKGVKIRRCPAPPAEPVTVARIRRPQA